MFNIKKKKKTQKRKTLYILEMYLLDPFKLKTKKFFTHYL